MPKLAPEDVVQLRNPITLSPGSKVTIMCHYSVQVEVIDHDVRCPNGRGTRREVPMCLLSATTPLPLTATKAMRITPSEPLSPEFAEGWRKLPDELRVEVLAHNLVCRQPIVHNHVRSGDKLRLDCALGTQLRHHLALGPEFASLARQIFYERNTFTVRYNELPPIAVRGYIRSISMNEKHRYSHESVSWKILERLAAGTLGMDNLQHLRLRLEPAKWDSSYGTYEITGARKTLRFPFRGELVVEACPGMCKLGHSGSYCPHGNIVQQVEQLIKFAQ